MSITINSDGVLEQVSANLTNHPSWMPRIVETAMLELGGRVIEKMREQVEPNRYTGSLSESIISEYDSGKREVSIFPTAARGTYDAGTILELGTAPIPNVPWAPIASWAVFRGLPAFPVWYKIKTVGVSAHPFLQSTLDNSEEAMTIAALKIISDAAGEIMEGKA